MNFISNDKSLLRVETKLSEEYSDKNNNELSKINWVFYAQYEGMKPEIINEVPKTDINNNIIVMISIIVLLTGVIMVLYSKRKDYINIKK